MANHQILDNNTHSDLKVITGFHPSLGDNHSYTRLVMSELKYAQAEYPIFFRKSNESGQFEIIAMLGLDSEENLFVDESGWNAHYLPLSIERKPFLIGFQQTDHKVEPSVHIDMDSPRVTQTTKTDSGEVCTQIEHVFLPQGGQSPYLQRIGSILSELHSGKQAVEAFVSVLQDFELIEIVELNIQLDNQEKIALTGLYTIHEERLNTLTAEQLEVLHSKGYLESIYMIIAATVNLTKLIELKNQRLNEIS